MQSLVGLAILLYAATLIAACVGLWIFIFKRFREGTPVLEARPAPPANWGLVDVLGGAIGVIFLIIVFSAIAVGPRSSSSELTIEQQSGMMWAQMFAQSLVCLIILGLIFLRGGRNQIFGDSPSTFLNDVKIGIAAFGALCVPVLVLQMILALLVPYEHQLIDMMLTNPTSNIIIPVVFSAVIIAPLTEEFAFRLVLQGWLEDVLSGRLHNGVEILLGRIVGLDLNRSETFEVASEPLVKSLPASDVEESANPYQSPLPETVAAEVPVNGNEARPQLMAVPILVSSLLFAGLHLGQGAAPIPLFVLALGLGYVYQKTRTLTPSLVVHMLLNGQSMLLLLLQLIFGDGLTEPPV
ncbi:CPBP family intramembrane glutamic endopeptidase [Bremerella sp. JC817]|uniref:CPBP family intramembrane glutamic endopeptidase n=1 Tax=Bremerella sp. JC817 TaxID=3231756 RepID=UPI0034595960